MTDPAEPLRADFRLAPVASEGRKGDGQCIEHLGAEGLAGSDSCTRLGGVYAKGPTPCSHDNLIGSCAQVDTGSNLNDVTYYYKQAGSTEANMKTLCDTMSGTWSSAPKAGPRGKGK